jgi:hypothetical protein
MSKKPTNPNDGSSQRSFKCFSNYHLTTAEHSFHTVCLSVSHETGKLYSDGRAMALKHKNMSKNTPGRLLKRLMAQGWIQEIRKPRRGKHGVFECGVYTVIDHDAWAASHPGCCQDPEIALAATDARKEAIAKRESTSKVDFVGRLSEMSPANGDGHRLSPGEQPVPQMGMTSPSNGNDQSLKWDSPSPNEGHILQENTSTKAINLQKQSANAPPVPQMGMVVSSGDVYRHEAELPVSSATSPPNGDGEQPVPQMGTVKPEEYHFPNGVEAFIWNLTAKRDRVQVALWVRPRVRKGAPPTLQQVQAQFPQFVMEGATI